MKKVCTSPRFPNCRAATRTVFPWMNLWRRFARPSSFALRCKARSPPIWSLSASNGSRSRREHPPSPHRKRTRPGAGTGRLQDSSDTWKPSFPTAPGWTCNRDPTSKPYYRIGAVAKDTCGLWHKAGTAKRPAVVPPRRMSSSRGSASSRPSRGSTMCPTASPMRRGVPIFGENVRLNLGRVHLPNNSHAGSKPIRVHK